MAQGEPAAKYELFARQTRQLRAIALRLTRDDTLIDHMLAEADIPLEKALASYKFDLRRYQVFSSWCRSYVTRHFQKIVREAGGGSLELLEAQATSQHPDGRKDGVTVYATAEPAGSVPDELPRFLNPATNQIVVLLTQGFTESEARAMVGCTKTEFAHKITLIRQRLA
jgi:DNA-directed RNA polymerase specialized sigma24 family protein